MKDQLSRVDFLIAIKRAEDAGFHSLALALTVLFRNAFPKRETP